jgi:hypothetical protein
MFTLVSTRGIGIPHSATTGAHRTEVLRQGTWHQASFA